MQERHQEAEKSRLLSRAMVEFQSTCPVVRKSQQVKFGNTNYTFAPLQEIAATIQPHLTNCGLFVRWDEEETDGHVVATCTVEHVGGGCRNAKFRCKIGGTNAMSDQQKTASANTYAKRQSLLMVLGITTGDVDDDAQATRHEVSEKDLSDLRAALATEIPDAKDRKAYVVKLGVTGDPTRPESWTREQLDKAREVIKSQQGE